MGFFCLYELVRARKSSYKSKKVVCRFTDATHILLPILTSLRFNGDSEYLDNLVAWINAPLLHSLDVTFFVRGTLAFDTSQLTRFIRRTPRFKTQDEARVVYSWSNLLVTLPRIFDGKLHLKFLVYIIDLNRTTSLRSVLPSVSYFHGETPLHP
jgi:hypothetical protein